MDVKILLTICFSTCFVIMIPNIISYIKCKNVNIIVLVEIIYVLCVFMFFTFWLTWAMDVPDNINVIEPKHVDVNSVLQNIRMIER